MEKKSQDKVKAIATIIITQLGREGSHHQLDEDEMRELDSAWMKLATYVTDRFENLTEEEVEDAIKIIELIQKKIESFKKTTNDCSDGFYYDDEEQEEIMEEEEQGQGHEDKMEELIGNVKETDMTEEGNLKKSEAKRKKRPRKNLTAKSEGNRQKRQKIGVVI